MHSGPLRSSRAAMTGPGPSLRRPESSRRRETGFALVEIDYRTLTVGTRLPETAFEADRRLIAAYREAVEDHGQSADEAVPPMAVAAFAMGALSRIMSLPFGAIHISQELFFPRAVAVGEKLTCSGELIGRRDRRDFHLLTFRLDVRDVGEERVLSAKTGLLLPRGQSGEPGGSGDGRRVGKRPGARDSRRSEER